MILTYRFRLKDKHAAELNRQASAVNYVWNYCNETQRKAAQSGRRWISGFDLTSLTSGSSTMLDLHSHTICEICRVYHTSRSTKRRPWLRFRGKKSLGWIPFRKDNVRVESPGCLRFRGKLYEAMHWREIPDEAVILAGSFSRDARGRWYINCPVEVSADLCAPESSVGIDLGLKDLGTLSNGVRVEHPAHYRKLEKALGVAQRANKSRQVASINAKIFNARKDFLHKASADITENHNLIVAGNVSSSKLAQTKMAKSVLDAGWSSFRSMLSYKAIRHGGTYIEVDERYTTQTCSSCGALPEGRPKGIAGLGIREWECSECGAVHDRDVNAARNILRVGLDTLAEGAVARRSSQTGERWS